MLGKNGKITDLNDYKKIIDNLDYVKINLDIGHAFANNPKEVIFNFIKENKERIYNFHFHDNNLEKDEHLPLGKGRIPWKEVVSILKEIKYNKTITLEIFRDEKELKESLNFILKLFKT